MRDRVDFTLGPEQLDPLCFQSPPPHYFLPQGYQYWPHHNLDEAVLTPDSAVVHSAAAVGRICVIRIPAN